MSEHTQQVSMRLPSALVQQIDGKIAALAVKTGIPVSRGAAIRAAIKMWLAAPSIIKG